MDQNNLRELLSLLFQYIYYEDDPTVADKYINLFLTYFSPKDPVFGPRSLFNTSYIQELLFMPSREAPTCHASHTPPDMSNVMRENKNGSQVKSKGNSNVIRIQ